MVSRSANFLAMVALVWLYAFCDKCQGHFSFTVPNSSYPLIFKDRVSGTVKIEFEIQAGGVTVFRQFPLHDFYI